MKIIGAILIVLGVAYLGYGLMTGNYLGARTVAPLWNQSELNTEVSTGDFTNATTTPIAMANPFLATSTIDIFIYDQTGVATSTYSLACGTSTSPYLAPTDTIIDDVTVATSSRSFLVSGTVDAGTNSKQKIMVRPSEYFVCKATTAYESAFTGLNNTYDGNYVIRWFTNN